MFIELQHFLHQKASYDNLMAIFSQVDANGDGKFQRRQMPRLLLLLVPNANERELRYMQVPLLNTLVTAKLWVFPASHGFVSNNINYRFANFSRLRGSSFFRHLMGMLLNQ